MFVISYLSRFCTKWTTAHDKALHRLFNYVYETKELRLVSVFKPGLVDELEIHAYPDADHGGCKLTCRSTSGCWTQIASKDGKFFSQA